MSSKDMDAVDRAVQQRVTTAMAAAGLPQSRIDLEVLYMLPQTFLRAYQRLFIEALGDARETLPGNSQDAALGKPKSISRYRGEMPAPHGGGKRFRTNWVIKSEQAFDAKKSIDRRLERLAGVIAETMGSRDAVMLQCSSCLLRLEDAQAMLPIKMRFCPRCGVKLDDRGPQGE